MGATLVPIEGEDDPEGVWPDNVWAVRLMEWMRTQWRAGPAGLIGLDYNLLDRARRDVKVPRRKWREAFDGLQIIEDESLVYFAERSSQ